tara:strand:- start:41 stop:358 length:318 start_codon:yes stop_codon:yes gene_type:complete
MRYIFSQITGLGHSALSQTYAISGVDEARAYLSHPVLGPKLNDCRQLVMGVKGKSAHEIFGSPDDMKFHSSMTLFNKAEEGVFQLAISAYYEGRGDDNTLALLKG